MSIWSIEDVPLIVVSGVAGLCGRAPSRPALRSHRVPEHDFTITYSNNVRDKGHWQYPPTRKRAFRRRKIGSLRHEDARRTRR